MKTNAIIRIIFFSIAVLVLTGVLVIGIAVDSFMFADGPVPEGTLPAAFEDKLGVSVADADTIQSLHIEWVAGTIRLQQASDTANITVTETYPEGYAEPMLCQQSGDTLVIQFNEDSIHFPSFGISTNSSKDLVITVPNDWTCTDLEIETASANVQVNDLTIQEVHFSGASGICDFENCHVDTLTLDTASGDVNFRGTLDVMDCDAVSANFCGILDQAPTRLDFDGVSGDLDITLPDDCGFCVNLDSISGNFNTDFPTTSAEGRHLHGDGSCQINADGVSGNITIRKGGYCGTLSADSAAAVCTDSNCTDENHGHNVVCTDANCTDESHGHNIVCTDANCTDESHGHSTNHSENDPETSHHSSKHHG